MAPSTGPIDLTRAVWRKSTWSSSEGQNCVEVATNLPGIVAVRDSRHPAGRPLVVTSRNWAAFIRAMQAGALASSSGELTRKPALSRFASAVQALTAALLAQARSLRHAELVPPL